MPTRNDSDSESPKLSGETKPTAKALKPPADAGVERADAETGRLVERRVDAHRLGGDRLVADRDQRPADAPADEISRRPVEDRRANEADEVEPLVGGQRQPNGACGFTSDTPCEPPVQASKPL